MPLADLGHGLTERLEVVRPGLIDKDVAIGQEQNPLTRARFPQSPDDLEGCVGLAGASGHDQQNAILSFGDSLNGAIDSVQLVIARLLAAPVTMEILGENSFDGIVEVLVGTVPLPQLGR